MSASTGQLISANDVVEQGLSLSKSSSCIVIVDESFESEVRFANNTTTTNGQRRDRRVTVISFDERPDGTAIGVASKSGSADLEELVRASELECSQSPLAEDVAPLIGGAQSLNFDDELARTDLSALSGVLESLPGAFSRAESESTLLAGFTRHSLTTSFLGSSTGLRLRHAQPDGTIELVARSNDGRRSAWAGIGTMDFSDVVFNEVHNRLRTRLEWAQRKIDVPAGRYEAILPADAVADLMIPLAEALSGRDAEEGQSVFSSPKGTRIGEIIGALPFSLTSDPNYPGLECDPFVLAHSSGSDVSVFDNGSPVERTSWIDEGKLAHLYYHRAGAARSNVAFTPPGDNLILGVPDASGSLEDLIGRTERGLLLTCLWYIREVDLATLLLTGLTRDGVYLVEGGEVVGAVNNFRFNESPVDVLARSIEASSTKRCLSHEWNEWMSLTAMPALRVADFNMSSVSPAN